ncbi:Flagellum-specific ATP synthase FliI [Labilithrix luteola]|uniref:Flagellum-specific ATP synthase FliI n=1 Tax=Labilithrix luteola TaxID=1391654 RepID=A0A0K1Q1T1_9BACT|nr:FliI/YscN family ATPase [Labilithrix luteola]AKU99728.1 Flagellum-specific ATP synthase FliI [Labilithrix luteola]
MSTSLDALKAKLAATPALRATGRVISVTGLSLRFSMPGVRVGDVVSVRRRGEPLACEVVGFDRGEAVGMPLGALTGVGPDDEVEATGGGFTVRASDALLGRVVDGLGRPIDGQGSIDGIFVPVDRDPEGALVRRPVSKPLATGVRVLDGLLTMGEGQRVGLFAGSGVGKSTLLGAIARGTSAEVVVVALVGERGREVGEFLEHALGAEGRARSVVVVATSDVAALERLRAAQVATAYAEYFRDQGKSVMLLVDSVTRFARAQREVGLAAGEPPARRGYPPSVFAMLPRLLERSGQGSRGSITAIYTVLVEGGDMDEPIADEVRGILDGHVVLDRTIGARGRYPAVEPTVSLSRVMDAVVQPAHRDAARKLRSLVAHYEAKRDLVMLGAYAKGSDKELDEAIARMPKIEQFLRQSPHERVAFEDTVAMLQKVIA